MMKMSDGKKVKASGRPSPGRDEKESDVVTDCLRATRERESRRRARGCESQQEEQGQRKLTSVSEDGKIHGEKQSEPNPE